MWAVRLFITAPDQAERGCHHRSALEIRSLTNCADGYIGEKWPPGICARINLSYMLL